MRVARTAAKLPEIPSDDLNANQGSAAAVTTPTKRRERWPTIASLVLVALLIPAIVYGLLADEAYRGYDSDVVLTSRTQDVLPACVLPILVWTSIRSRRGSLRAHILWSRWLCATLWPSPLLVPTSTWMLPGRHEFL
jgi:hypothetical protein